MRNRIIPYNPQLKLLARRLRNQSTPSEVVLWNQLKNKQMLGYDFHRQKPLLNYIVDFYCPELELAIEIDGSTHNEKLEQDAKRQEDLEKLGLHFLRFLDFDVRTNLDGIVTWIRNWILEHAAEEHTPTRSARHPSREGREQDSPWIQ